MGRIAQKESSIIDKNIRMLSKEVERLRYQYRNMLPNNAIRERLKEYRKIKEEKRTSLHPGEYLMVSGYINALEWVLSNTKEEDISLQRQDIYAVEHKMVSSKR